MPVNGHDPALTKVCFLNLQTIRFKKILLEINEEVYQEKIKFIKENFELSKKYIVADNLIFEKLKEI